MIAKETRFVLVFPPYHTYIQGRANSEKRALFTSCKQRLLNLFSKRDNSYIVDFMIPSEITINDENYWAPLHYNRKIARKLPELIKQAIKGDQAPNGEYQILLRP